MSVPREGGCGGAVRYRLTSDPLFTHCCYCLNCQRQTGSAFVINLLIEADRVAHRGRPAADRRASRRRQRATDLPLSDLPGGGLQPVRAPEVQVAALLGDPLL